MPTKAFMVRSLVSWVNFEKITGKYLGLLLFFYLYHNQPIHFIGNNSILQRRIQSKDRRMTLGRYGPVTVEQARKHALKLSGEIATGGDPIAEKNRQKALAKTLEDVFLDYQVARKDLKPLTVKDMTRSFKEMCPDWLNKPLIRITPALVERRHRDFGERSPARANLGMRYLRALFNFAAAKYVDGNGEPFIAINPVGQLSKTKAWYRVERRQTVIRPHEIGRWFNAVRELPGEDIRDYFVFVLLTGLRREEALGLKWGHVDLIGRTFTVIDPKNRQNHTLPLSDYLDELLTTRKAASACEFVFADKEGRRISNFRYAHKRVTEQTGIQFCIHDLRRTFATLAESLDIPAYALKRLLNHKDGADVTAGYIVASVERLREPMQKVTEYVLKAAGLKPTAEVIALQKIRG